MASVRRPRRALASARPAATVVLPTPPFPTTNCSRRSRSDTGTGSAVAAEAERHVRPAEAEGVGQGRLDLDPAGAVGDVVEVALRVGLVDVDGGREDAARERERGVRGLDRARRAETVPRHRLRGADGDARGVL